MKQRWWLVSLVLLGAAPDAPTDVRTDEALVAYLERLRLGNAPTPETVLRLERAGINEDLVDRWLAQLQRACLDDPERCDTLGAGRSKTGQVTDQLIELLGAMGTAQSAGLLLQLDGRGAFVAYAAIAQIEARALTRRAHSRCTAPTEAETLRAEQRLEGFPVLTHVDQTLTARLLTPPERGDLAYFLAATNQLTPPEPKAAPTSKPELSCGTGAEIAHDEAIRALIVRAEASKTCRRAVMPRMLRLPTEGYQLTPDVYGVGPLQRAGFDVERLYRGALLSVNHGVADDDVHAAVTRAPPHQRAVMQTYLDTWGHPDWEYETRALEGWAQLRGRDAFSRLLELAATAVPSVRLRALSAIENLAGQSNAACGSGLCIETSFSFSDASRAGPVSPLDTTCAAALTNAERDALATSLLALAADPSAEFREALAQTLGAVASPLARELLQRGSGRGLTRLAAFERSQACERRFWQAHPDASGGRFVAPASQQVKVSPKLQGLMDVAHRNQTLCDLVAAGRHRRGSEALTLGLGDTCIVNHVLVAPQASTSPAVVVFTDSTWAHLAGPGKPKGPFAMFDAEGFQLPVFENANVVDADDDIFSYRADGSLAFGLTIPSSEHERTLHIVPVAPQPVALLSVEFSWPAWSWRLAADGPALPPRIELGTQEDLARNAPAAIYRWSASRQRYEGPPGGPGVGYQRTHGHHPCPAQ